MDNSDSAYCRLCAESKPNSKLINMQTDDGKRREIIEKLRRVNGNVDLDLQSLPNTVCFVCLNSLDRAFEFVCGIEKAQSVLQNIITVQQIKKETALSDNESCDSFSYEPLPDVKYDAEIDVKLESPEPGSKEKLKSSGFGAMKRYPVQKQKKRPKNSVKSSLDAIPLAQLKLTWKDYYWVCSFCETQFVSVDELRTHSMMYHNCCNAYRCSDCNVKKYRLDNFIIHVKKHRKFLKLSCYVCFQRFPTPREVNVHRSIHITSTNICGGCNTSFNSVEELSKHTSEFYKERQSRLMTLPDTEGDNLTCLLCKKTFKYKGSLTTHLLTHTERKRDHTCDKCGKCFLTKQNLAGHMVLHSDMRPYQCEICRYAFKTPQQLRNHVGVHDGHKPYSCDQCGRCFRLQKQLTSHSIIHTDLLPHVCSYCNKGFRFKTILNQHLRQHTGIKPYSCDLCQRDFTNWPNYNKHMKRRHGMDMAKKKHTPDGVYPINPITGEIIVYPETNKTIEWKKKMIEQRRGPGRPKQRGDEENSTLTSERVTEEQKS